MWTDWHQCSLEIMKNKKVSHLVVNAMVEMERMTAERSCGALPERRHPKGRGHAGHHRGFCLHERP